jgi:hypothetical protein
MMAAMDSAAIAAPMRTLKAMFLVVITVAFLPFVLQPSDVDRRYSGALMLTSSDDGKHCLYFPARGPSSARPDTVTLPATKTRACPGFASKSAQVGQARLAWAGG